MKVTDTINGTTTEYETVEEMYEGIKEMFDGELDSVIDDMASAGIRDGVTSEYEEFLAISIDWS